MKETKKSLTAQNILNLTQHDSSPDQWEAGVVEVEHSSDKEDIKKWLTFDIPPSIEEMRYCAHELSALAHGLGFSKAMIGGAPFFMGILEKELRSWGVTPVYAFSKRESIEENGVKKSVFRHLGFVEGCAHIKTSPIRAHLSGFFNF